MNGFNPEGTGSLLKGLPVDGNGNAVGIFMLNTTSQKISVNSENPTSITPNPIDSNDNSLVLIFLGADTRIRSSDTSTDVPDDDGYILVKGQHNFGIKRGHYLSFKRVDEDSDIYIMNQGAVV